MELFLRFAATLLVAFLFGTIAVKLKIPAGGMLGSMIGVAIFNLMWGKAYMYSTVKVVIQICLGTMSGSKVGRKELKEMKGLILPLILVIAVCLTLNIIFGAAIVKTTSLDISTALLSITPGGATDMVFVAADIGADTGMVGLLQSLRMIYCNGLLPIIFVTLVNRKQGNQGKVSKGGLKRPQKQSSKKEGRNIGKTIAMFAVSSCGGLLFRSLGIPGGTLVGAMLFTVVFTCLAGKAEYPAPIKRYQQMFTGAFIGLSITKETIAAIPSMAMALVLIVVDIMVYVFLMSAILHKTSSMDYGTCLLCSTPGGIGEVSVLSEELGTNTVQVATLNTARMIAVVATFPSILTLIARLAA